MSTIDLTWSDKFSTDIVSIDRQHQQLLFLSQNLLSALSNDGASLAEKQAAFQDLADNVLAHFAYEERIMRNIGYPNFEQHIVEHNDIRAEIKEMMDDVMHGDSVDDWKGLVSMVQVWVLRHIAASDTPIRDFIQRTDDEGWVD